MKNLKSLTLFFSLIFGLLIVLSACHEEKKQPKSKGIVLTGTIKNIPDTTFVFSYYTYDFLKNLKKKKVTFRNGNFKLKMEPSAPIKGWFSFGKVPISEKFEFTKINGRDTVMKTGTFDFRMIYVYLQPGDSLNLRADAGNIANTLHFSGDHIDNSIFVNIQDNKFNNYKHKFLNNWYNVANRKPDDYKRVTDDNYKKKMAFLKNVTDSMTLSNKLVDYFKNNYYADAVGSKINYPSIHSSYNENKKTKLPPDYYDFMNNVSMKAKISANGWGYFYNLRSYLNKKYELAEKNSEEKRDFYDWLKTELPEEARYEYMGYALGNDFSKRLYSEFGADSPFPKLAKEVRKKYKGMKGMMEGSPAPNIAFEDMQGKIVSIQDLEGKYTYIDLWATWCGPCIKEMPSLKKLQKKYKNIQFVSVSIDDEKDHSKWQDFVKKKNLKGMQLIASEEAHKKLVKSFNLKMIPRFILIDPEGKIVDATAPFPSDPKLETLFKEKDI